MAESATARRSPLDGLVPTALPGLEIGERPLGSLVQVAAFPSRQDDAPSAVDAALGRENIPPMPGPLQSTTRGGTTIMNVAPDRALIAAARPDLHAALSASIPVEEGTVTDLSHARILLCLKGIRARWVLSKGIAIDLHPHAFPVGHTVLTDIAHIGVILRRADEDAYDLYPYRGYARALLAWLCEAGAADGRQAA
ncbi:MAG: sarcosine oxidase subunit gamma family protein [Devosia sp.]